MLYLKDKADNVWSWLDFTNTKEWVIKYEDGTSKLLEFSDLIFQTGKYEGRSLDQVTDKEYLQFLLTVDNDFVKYAAKRRLDKLPTVI